MNSINRNPILTVSLFFIILILSNNSLLAYISCNGSGSGYDDPDTGEDLIKNTASIDTLITEGAGYYLQGNADIQTLLNRVELQDLKGIDYLEMQRLVDSALQHITNARLTYEKLVSKAEATPYNPVVIEQLKSFDYNSFMLENRLNETIFKKAAGYLVDGDITGSFRHVLSVVRYMEFLLTVVKTEMYFNRLEIYWQLNDLCAETTLFGSFIARVFHQINTFKSN
ncbi:MAG: hypothetical protein PVH61_42980 [Candidatus Aminicenantes bacterium]|jgi:hypothetical protein